MEGGGRLLPKIFIGGGGRLLLKICIGRDRLLSNIFLLEWIALIPPNIFIGGIAVFLIFFLRWHLFPNIFTEGAPSFLYFFLGESLLPDIFIGGDRLLPNIFIGIGTPAS